ncbi:cytochrome P450 [Mycobacterium sp. Aquia_213]|uniref:cytochrome P450 n=1 Tax=Mycobacterium sp. Aquia_213 TaxID=2991728 RepID=UPI002270BB43|nr:cytochrome P450 [Mycobacterium sp. Aquia_213]WAC92464.1 cytochrome P450 [Mycobacterium sp. Aquia_213]
MTTTPQLPFVQESPLDIAPELRAIQRGTIHRVRTATGDEAWLVLDYAHVRQLLDDERLGRAHPDPQNAPRVSESPLLGIVMGNFETEAADHAVMRNLLQPHFSPKHLRALVPRVEEFTTALLDEMVEQGPPADLHSQLAMPLPILVICELLGVPYSDRDQFRQWTEDVGNLEDRTRSERGMAELFGYSMKLVQHKRAHPDDDVISRLSAADDLDDTGATLLSFALLFAGHETTVVQISLGTLMLLANRDQWSMLQNQPALIPRAVEELMRASTMGATVGGIPRYARSDFDFNGVTIHAGDLVLLDIISANHDPTVFADPEQLTITRNEAAHLSFGFGPHYCVGAQLARIQLQTVFTQLIRRFPSMQLTCDPAAVPMRQDTITGGLVQLPVSW